MAEKLKALAMSKHMRWVRGNCNVEVGKRGHYPDTVWVKLPNDVHTEVYLDGLEEIKNVQH
jgi:hypothetical protein